MRTNQLHRRAAVRAFTLIEVTLALGVAGFCLVTIFGLLPIGLISNQASLDQTMAGNIAGALVSDLRSAQSPGAASSPRFGLSIPAASATAEAAITTTSPQTIYLASNGIVTTGTGSGPAAPVFRATIAFGTPLQRNSTPVRVFITWPALADSNPGVWPVHYTGCYEADTTLDRN
jgi:hypothetical protein